MEEENIGLKMVNQLMVTRVKLIEARSDRMRLAGMLVPIAGIISETRLGTGQPLWGPSFLINL